MAQRSSTKRQKRGAAAQRLTEDPAFLEALAWVSNGTIDRFKQSKNPDEAWAARLAFQAADNLATVLVAYVKDGQSAAIEADRKMKPLKTPDVDKQFEKYLAEARKVRKELNELRTQATTPE